MLQPLVDGTAMAQLELVTGSDAVKSLQVLRPAATAAYSSRAARLATSAGTRRRDMTDREPGPGRIRVRMQGGAGRIKLGHDRRQGRPPAQQPTGPPSHIHCMHMSDGALRSPVFRTARPRLSLSQTILSLSL